MAAYTERTSKEIEVLKEVLEGDPEDKRARHREADAALIQAKSFQRFVEMQADKDAKILQLIAEKDAQMADKDAKLIEFMRAVMNKLG
jgi:predicted ABC-type transport system involved in lysophospholipase L1 biosynthesis ATPase subunit